MNVQEILSHCDHTLLGQTSTWEEIRQICDDGMKYNTASVCIPPSYVKTAAEYIQTCSAAQGKEPLKVCTVIGFPNGYNTTAVKAFETKDALENGASEIDMVVNLGWVRQGWFQMVEEEIRCLKKICGDHVLKVIVETCLLTEEEKAALCGCVTRAGADFIKTSTGFSKGGATFDDIKLFAANIGPGVRMKASGGISSLEDAEEFLRLGCDRLGTSRIVKIVKAGEAAGNAGEY